MPGVRFHVHDHVHVRVQVRARAHSFPFHVHLIFYLNFYVKVNVQYIFMQHVHATFS
jgi:hypothetical protein